MNVMSHEVEINDIAVNGNTLKGTFTVIVHDDIWGDMHFESAQAECRTVGEGPGLAMRYTVESQGEQVSSEEGARRIENRGTYNGTIGVAWSRTGRLTGSRDERTGNE